MLVAVSNTSVSAHVGGSVYGVTHVLVAVSNTSVSAHVGGSVYAYPISVVSVVLAESPSVDDTSTELVTLGSVKSDGTSTNIVTKSDAGNGSIRSDSGHVTVPDGSSKHNGDDSVELNIVPIGIVSITSIPVALDRPAFVTVIVYSIVSPAFT